MTPDEIIAAVIGGTNWASKSWREASRIVKALGDDWDSILDAMGLLLDELDRLRAIEVNLQTVGSIRLLQAGDGTISWMTHSNGRHGSAPTHAEALAQAGGVEPEEDAMPTLASLKGTVTLPPGVDSVA
ncbi:MAG: hypothetical protein IMZ50_09995, partial [Candidatus Atribacteria bacterium]|nr:hypothetical protein [Candidatus Atribacteria bacterium]